MTSKSKAKYSLEDFFTKTNNEKASKMPLLFDGEDTGMYLMVKGVESRSVAQAKLEAQKEYALMDEENKTDIDSKILKSAKRSKIMDSYACALVDGWSFDEPIDNLPRLISENQGLSSAVIAHASTETNYFAKK